MVNTDSDDGGSVELTEQITAAQHKLVRQETRREIIWVTEEEEFKILQWFMIKHSIVELYAQYETLKGFKVKVLFNNLDARYT